MSNIISEGTEQVVSSRKEGLEKEEEEEEDGYFSTYSHYSIHEEMLKVSCNQQEVLAPDASGSIGASRKYWHAAQVKALLSSGHFLESQQ